MPTLRASIVAVRAVFTVASSTFYRRFNVHIVHTSLRVRRISENVNKCVVGIIAFTCPKLSFALALFTNYMVIRFRDSRYPFASCIFCLCCHIHFELVANRRSFLITFQCVKRIDYFFNHLFFVKTCCFTFNVSV